jgi:hypothetical protein
MVSASVWSFDGLARTIDAKDFEAVAHEVDQVPATTAPASRIHMPGVSRPFRQLIEQVNVETAELLLQIELRRHLSFYLRARQRVSSGVLVNPQLPLD